MYAEIWADFYKQPLDEMPSFENEVQAQVRYTILEGQWYEAYDLLEFAINTPSNSDRSRLRAGVAKVLAEEMAGVRLIGDTFAEITDETEVVAIEQAFATAATDRFAPAHEHLRTALALLSDRRTPDYRNSMKESISAVEAVAQILTGDPQAELGKALKMLRTAAPIHGALRSALLSLYGYTSDADGIRHALTDETSVDAADAKFMLVACSAFVVYLIQKAGAS